MKSNIKWIQYSSFAAAGVAGNLISSLLPYIRKDINMTYGQSGMLLSEPFIGMLLVGLLSSYIIKKYGNKIFLLVGGISLFLGFLGTMISTSYQTLFYMNFITVIGFGVYEVGINTLCADYSTSEKGNDMNLLHFFYGLGAIASSVLAFVCTNLLGIWRLSFAVALILPSISIYFLVHFKEKEKRSTRKASDGDLKKVKETPLKSILIWIAGFATFIYIGIEVSTYGWIPEFWKTVGKDSMIPPSLATGLFWISMTLGRLITGRIADKIGLLKYILAASIGISVISLSWVILPQGIWTIISILIIGFLLSGLYPTIMAFATSMFPDDTSTVAAFISVLGSIGGVIIPSFIGKISDNSGIGILPTCILVLSLVFTVLNFLWCLYKNYRLTKSLS